MKKSILVSFLVAVLICTVGCSAGTDSKEQSTTSNQNSTASQSDEQTEPIRAATFDGDLEDYFKVDKDVVYHFSSNDGSRLDLIAAADEHMNDTTVYHFEGEFYDSSDELLDYYNAVYLLTPQMLCQTYSSNPLKSDDGQQTVWLKSPVAPGDTWQTTYCDEAEGFVDAVVTVAQIESDRIKVNLEVVDQSVAEANRKALVREFKKAGLPMSAAVLQGDDTLAYSESFDYKPGKDATNLKRYFSDDANIKALFSNNPIEIKRLVAEYKRKVRETDDIAEIAELTKFYLATFYGMNSADVPNAMLDIAAYGLARTDANPVVLDAFIESVNFNIYGLTFVNFIGDYALYLNNTMNEVLRLTDFDGEEMFKRDLPIPQAGEFMGAKYLEKAYRDNNLYYSVSPYDMETLEIVNTDLIQPKDVVYSNAKYAFNTLLNSDNGNVATYVELATLIEMVTAEYNKDYYERQGVDAPIFKDSAYYHPYIMELIENADYLYEQLDETYRAGAKYYMNQIVQMAFMRRELPGKYYTGVALNREAGIDHITRNSYDYESTTEMYDRELAGALRDFLREHPKSYFKGEFAAALDSLEKHNYCYHQSLEDKLLDLAPYNGMWEAPYSAYTMSDDLKNYYQDLAVGGNSEALPAATTVDDLESLVDAIKPGATVMLKPQTYLIADSDGTYRGEYAEIKEGKLTIFDVEDLTISAERGFAQIITYQLNNVVELRNCKNVTLRGLRLGHIVKEYCNGSAIFITDSHGVNLKESIFYGCGFNGITVWDSDGVAVSDSVISGCDSDGISIRDSAQMMIKHCYLRDNDAYAIQAINSKDITISNCTTDNNFSDPEYVITQEAIIYGINSTMRLTGNTYQESIAPCVYDGGEVTID
ncbi:MAG: hypothetical protein CSB19_01295 [Clostridiales bacterium]|nr:MAG: hypothetical protein CSB19_01295 [Clostridiales bacterium]